MTCCTTMSKSRPYHSETTQSTSCGHQTLHSINCSSNLWSISQATNTHYRFPIIHSSKILGHKASYFWNLSLNRTQSWCITTILPTTPGSLALTYLLLERRSKPRAISPGHNSAQETMSNVAGLRWALIYSKKMWDARTHTDLSIYTASMAQLKTLATKAGGHWLNHKCSPKSSF